MRRIILFRGKRFGSDEWVEGLLTTMWGQYHIINPDDEKIAYPVRKSTITQYTGLTDKNKCKIWENDIVRCDKRGAAFWRCRVIWEKDYARYGIDVMDCAFPLTVDKSEGNISIHGLDYEVIGNVYDNPELLHC